MERRGAERAESEQKKRSARMAIEFLLNQRGQLLTSDQRKEIGIAECYFGPWRPIGKDEQISPDLQKHVGMRDGVAIVPTRIFGQEKSLA